MLDFSEQQNYCVGSVAYRVQEESEPVMSSYFLWHFMVGQSLHVRQKGATCSRWNLFRKISPLLWGARHDSHTTSHISTNMWI